MEKLIEYEPYKNWKKFNIIEEDNKKFLIIGKYKLEINEKIYIPKAGLLFEEVLNENCKNKKILDVGCGQLGILGLIALNNGANELTSVDIDESCIKWLRKEAADNGIRNIRIFRSDLFENINSNEKFDIILSNPPHMPMKDGKICDSGGEDGRKIVDKVIKSSFDYLNEDGELYLMMFDFLGIDKSYNDKNTVFDLAKSIGYKDMSIAYKFNKEIIKGSVTYQCLNYIKTVYPKYNFGETNPICKIDICRFKK